jgi:hypothetical protein
MWMDETKEMTFHLKRKEKPRQGRYDYLYHPTYRDVDARFFHHPTIVVGAVLGQPGVHLCSLHIWGNSGDRKTDDLPHPEIFGRRARLVSSRRSIGRRRRVAALATCLDLAGRLEDLTSSNVTSTSKTLPYPSLQVRSA